MVVAKVVTCRSCGAKVVHMETSSGETILCDLAPFTCKVIMDGSKRRMAGRVALNQHICSRKLYIKTEVR